MKHDFAFVAVFSIISLLSIIFLGVTDVLGIALTGVLGGFLCALVTRRKAVRGGHYHRPWGSIFLCAGASAAIFSALMTGVMFLLAVAVGVTGSPYDAPQLNYFRISFFSFAILFAALVATLAAFDRWISGDKAASEVPKPSTQCPSLTASHQLRQKLPVGPDLEVSWDPTE